MTRRVVFIRPDGVRQICGTQDQLPGAALPITAENFTSLGETVPFASLVKVTHRAAYYKPPMLPPQSYGSFHEAQR